MVVVDQYTRRIIGFAVHAGNVDGPTLYRMFNEATYRQEWPKGISSDNDPLFQYHRWKSNLRVLEIEEIKSLPHVPSMTRYQLNASCRDAPAKMHRKPHQWGERMAVAE